MFGVSTGALRLCSDDCASKSYGRLEMYYGSQWNPFVITDFDMHDADLACRKLGYSYALAYAKVGTLGQVFMSINLLNVQVCVCYCGTDKKYLPQA